MASMVCKCVTDRLVYRKHFYYDPIISVVSVCISVVRACVLVFDARTERV